MTPDAAMIFAAGLGLRMGALTRTRPKPLIEVAGRPLVAHALAQARGAGVARIVVNTHAHAGQMRAWLDAEAPEVVVSHEPDLLETGGGLKQAAPLLGATAFTLNSDVVWRGPNPLALLAAAWDPRVMSGLLCLVPRGAAVGHLGPGDFFRAPDGALRRRGDAPSADFVHSGAQILDLGALTRFLPGAFSLNLVWDDLLAAGRLYGIVYPGRWVDVGRPESIPLAEAELVA